MKKILIIDDDESLCHLLSEYLSGESFEVHAIHNGSEAVELLQAEINYDLLILDIMLPGTDGLNVLRKLREQHAVPVIMLTAKGDDVDRIVGLELGADDYLPKPCNPRELLARVKAILRRAVDTPQQTETPDTAKIYQVQNLKLDSARREVTLNNSVLSLTSAEFAILEILIANPGAIISREKLSESGLGRALTPYDRSVDVHISKLRKKLVVNDSSVPWIANIRGRGYQLVQP